MINNRQAGRRRGRGGQRTPGGNPGRPDNGNRIDNRARGNAAQLLEKYKSLARDAQMQGDRVNTEYYLQFADHYFRVLNENRSRFEENQQRRGGANEAFDEESEEEFDGESYADDRVDGERAQQGGGNRRDGRDQGGNRDQGNGRDQGRDQGREQGRDQQDGYREQREGRDQQRYQPRDGNRDQPREQGRDQGRDNNRYRGEPRDAEPAPANGFHASEAPAGGEADRPRRGRPRRAVSAEGSADGPSRSDADAAPAAIEADRLPPALSLSSDAAEGGDRDGAGADAKPRRRRGRPAASEATPVS